MSGSTKQLPRFRCIQLSSMRYPHTVAKIPSKVKIGIFKFYRDNLTLQYGITWIDGSLIVLNLEMAETWLFHNSAISIKTQMQICNNYSKTKEIARDCKEKYITLFWYQINELRSKVSPMNIITLELRYYGDT